MQGRNYKSATALTKLAHFCRRGRIGELTIAQPRLCGQEQLAKALGSSTIIYY